MRCQNVHFNRKTISKSFALGVKIWRASKNSQNFTFSRRNVRWQRKSRALIHSVGGYRDAAYSACVKRICQNGLKDFWGNERTNFT
jgi:hypothetical protein